MRILALFPLAIAAAAGGCGSDVPMVPEESGTRGAAAPERDLTLQAPAAAVVEVASPVELSRPAPESKSPAARPPARPKPAPVPLPEPEPEAALVAEVEPVVLPTAAIAEAAVEPVPEEQPAADGRELAPGKTVTVIPASNGPLIEADGDDSWLPSERARGIIGAGGGTCRPRGGVRGIGIAGRIPVGIPARRLR